MAYSDYVATLGSAIQLVNDLDLSVRSPSGTIFYPNDRGAPDDLNNVEFLEFVPSETGAYVVEVSAPNVPMGDRQSYALVIRGYDTGPTNTLVIQPAGPMVATGPAGGPFTPDLLDYAVSNAGPDPVSWSAGKDLAADWVSLSVTSGVLPAGSSTTVIFSVDASASSLAGGIYAGMVCFTNHTSGDIHYRPVSLTVRPASRFQWSALTSPQQTGTAFSATLTAVDEHGDIVTSYSGPAALSTAVPSTNSIGIGTNAWGSPITSYYEDSRTQSIYLQSELGGAVLIDGLSIHVHSLPSMMLDNWTIRMKHTAWSNHPQAAWEGPNSGWTTVFSQDFTLPHTGWVHFAFSAPFPYDGTNNLLIDFTKNNHTYDGWAYRGYLSASTGQPGRTAYQTAGNYFGDPLLWTGTSLPPPLMTNLLPNIRLAYRAPVPVAPTQTGSFTNGAWSGSISIPTPVAQVVLRAQDGDRRGDTFPLDIEGTPPPPPDLPWASATNMTAFTADWTSVAGATSYRLDVGSSPDFSTFQPGYSNRLLSAPSCTVTGLAFETVYAFRLRAYAGPTPGPYSPTALVTTLRFTAPPAFTPINSLTATAGVLTTFTVAATGAPPPTLELQSTTASAGFQFQPASGLLSYTPPLTDGGLRRFTFQASNEVSVATQIVEVTVLSPLVAYEGFDITPGSGALAGASGASSLGWTNTWSVGVANHVVTQSLAYSNGGSLHSTTTGAAQLAVSGGQSFRSFTPAYTTGTGTYWISFLAVIPSNNSYAGFSVYSPFGERLFFGDLNTTTNWSAQTLGVTPGVTTSTTSSTTGQVLYVIRMDCNQSGGNEDVRVWINPQLSETPPPDHQATLSLLSINSDLTAANFSRIRLAQGGNGRNALFDEIRIGTTWGSVTPVVAGPLFDSDADGMPDIWEMQTFGTLTNQADQDLDEDGSPNRDEYLADTDPTNRASRFTITRVTPPYGASPLAVITDGRSGRIYRLSRSTNDLELEPRWWFVGQSSTLHSNQTVQLIDTNAVDVHPAFYRLEVAPSDP
jgi:hypothetical protein